MMRYLHLFFSLLNIVEKVKEESKMNNRNGTENIYKFCSVMKDGLSLVRYSFRRHFDGKDEVVEKKKSIRSEDDIVSNWTIKRCSEAPLFISSSSSGECAGGQLISPWDTV